MTETTTEAPADTGFGFIIEPEGPIRLWLGSVKTRPLTEHELSDLVDTIFYGRVGHTCSFSTLRSSLKLKQQHRAMELVLGLPEGSVTNVKPIKYEIRVRESSDGSIREYSRTLEVS